jgi:hypothetical protein
MFKAKNEKGKDYINSTATLSGKEEQSKLQGIRAAFPRARRVLCVQESRPA